MERRREVELPTINSKMAELIESQYAQVFDTDWFFDILTLNENQLKHEILNHTPVGQLYEFYQQVGMKTYTIVILIGYKVDDEVRSGDVVYICGSGRVPQKFMGQYGVVMNAFRQDCTAMVRLNVGSPDRDNGLIVTAKFSDLRKVGTIDETHRDTI